ncbi:MAG TPA: FAD-dependent oxidoreductase [Oligoflexia bacterium]|nr:FAD-dependent oxidoreductase [Oligoflexia bacterium]
MEHKASVAVVGGGVAGIVSAYLLDRAGYDVTLFEKNNYLGGHTKTVVLEQGPDAGLAVDTGFIVLNDQTYPLFHRFLRGLNVVVRFSDMSFGYYCSQTNFCYAGTSLSGLFAQRRNLFSARFYRMLRDIRRFSADALTALEDGRAAGKSLGEFISGGGYSSWMVQRYLLPMAAAIWSAPFQGIEHFPAESFFRFFKNHGLLSLENRPRWQTVVGGSYSYVTAFAKIFRGRIYLGQPVAGVARDERTGRIRVRLSGGEVMSFDRLIIAAHADQALAVLEDPSPHEARLLGLYAYQRNTGALHTDPTVLSPLRRAWASWNYTQSVSERADRPVFVTYHMNRLQGFKASRDYFVSLNPAHNFEPEKVLEHLDFEHPVYTMENKAAQPELAALNGWRGTYYCGSYFGYGFHEDAVRAAAAAVRDFGVEL